MKPQRSHTALFAAWAALTLCLVSACSMAAGESPAPPAASTQAAAPPAAADPNVARLAREFESRVNGLVLRIAREKRLSRKTVEAELGVRLKPVATRPGALPRWDVHGLFELGHGFRITVQDRESDVQLSVWGSAKGSLGCHLHTDPIRTALVDQWGYQVSLMGAGKRPFKLLRPAQTALAENIVFRLFDQIIKGPDDKDLSCTYLLDVAAPGR